MNITVELKLLTIKSAIKYRRLWAKMPNGNYFAVRCYKFKTNQWKHNIENYCLPIRVGSTQYTELTPKNSVSQHNIGAWRTTDFVIADRRPKND